MATKKAVWQGFVKSPETGKPVSGAEVRVFDADSGAAVTLYGDRDGAAGPGNPFFTGSDGFAQFYVDPARIRIEAYDGGQVAQFDDVLVGTVDEGGIVTASLADGSITEPKLATGAVSRRAASSDIVTQVADVTELLSLGESEDDGTQVAIRGYHPDSDVGGGFFYWDADLPRSNHNGGTIISPTSTWDGTTADLADFLDGTNETNVSANGCWVRIIDGAIESLQFGAGSGAGDLAAFQAAIDYTTDGELVVIDIAPGDYVDDLSTLSVGTRTVVWRERGDVSYATSAPPGQRTNASYTGDKSRPWYVGEFGYGKNVTSGTAADRPNIRVQRNANHAGGTTGGSVESSALSAYTNVGSSVENYETAMLATLDHAGGITGQNLVGFHTEGRKTGNGGAITFGANIVAKDLSGNSSSVSGGALIGLETTMSASGPDDAETRIATDIVLKKESAAASASYYAGLRIRPSSESGREATLNNGIVLDVGTGSSTLSRGILMRGGFVNGVVETEALGNPSLMRLGSDNASVTQSVMKIEGFGQNSVAARTIYGELEYRIQSPTDGSEQGAFSAKILSNGAEITALDLQGGSSANPVFVRVNSSLKQVTQGAVDSGGTGFRVLRVPN